MQRKDEIIESIVTILSKEDNVEKVFFFGDEPRDSEPYDIALIVFEKESPNYFISQFHYEALVKDINKNIFFNILPVNSSQAEIRLNLRLKDALCIYQKKETA